MKLFNESCRAGPYLVNYADVIYDSGGPRQGCADQKSGLTLQTSGRHRLGADVGQSGRSQLADFAAIWPGERSPGASSGQRAHRSDRVYACVRVPASRPDVSEPAGGVDLSAEAARRR